LGLNLRNTSSLWSAVAIVVCIIKFNQPSYNIAIGLVFLPKWVRAEELCIEEACTANQI
jgi:hypothetical protein